MYIFSFRKTRGSKDRLCEATVELQMCPSRVWPVGICSLLLCSRPCPSSLLDAGRGWPCGRHVPALRLAPRTTHAAADCHVEESNLHGSLGHGLQQVGTEPWLNAEEKRPRASPGGWGQQMCLQLPALLCEGVRSRPSSAGDCWEMQGAGGARRMASASGGKMRQRA